MILLSIFLNCASSCFIACFYHSLIFGCLFRILSFSLQSSLIARIFLLRVYNFHVLWKCDFVSGEFSSSIEKAWSFFFFFGYVFLVFLYRCFVCLFCSYTGMSWIFLDCLLVLISTCIDSNGVSVIPRTHCVQMVPPSTLRECFQASTPLWFSEISMFLHYFWFHGWVSSVFFTWNQGPAFHSDALAFQRLSCWCFNPPSFSASRFEGHLLRIGHLLMSILLW